MSYERKPVQTKAAPTAGPSEDDRYGAGKVGSNLSARIIKVDIVGGRTRITIAQGTTHGAHTGMEGYIKSADGALATFQISEAKEAVSYADVDVTPDQLRNTPTVVINPTSHNAPRIRPITSPESSRVIGVNVVEGQTRITIARGRLQGVTWGMRGTLQGNLGNAGEEFTITEVGDRVSHAIVKGTVDQVQAHSFVVLYPSAKGGAVQRRANGAAAMGDVQSTAEAGVAGASSRLPFFETIQRSFGKHDISGVQAQVGGAATAASQALGAQAYATGNKVAFASAPDLHTAAHEAAHTIQQARGAVGFQGLGAADDEHERHADAVADAVVAGQSAEPLLDQLAGGGSAGAVQRQPAEPHTPNLDDYLTNITHSFHWFSTRASTRVDKLKDDVEKKDEPHWLLPIAEACLSMALGAGTAGAGVFLSEKLIGKIAKVASDMPSEAEKEFLKVTFENGLNEGISAGRSKLGMGSDGNVIAPFFLAQKDGIETSQRENQSKFILSGRHQIKTIEEAKRLNAACSPEHVNEAADKQYEATRDAWVSYLAQAKYGSIEDRNERPADPTKMSERTTNMQPQSRRDKVNESAPGFVPEDAPDLMDAAHGTAPGVLFIVAELPAIRGNQMLGEPRIKIAILNGVNERVAKQYVDVPVGAMRIPRQIIAKVDGSPDFTLNLDEKGEQFGVSYKEQQWLMLRAVVGHPENAGKSDWERLNAGRSLLLMELVPSSIAKRML